MYSNFLYKNIQFKNVKRNIIIALIFFIMSAITNALLQYIQTSYNFHGTINWIITHTENFLLGTILIYTFYILIICIVGNVYVGGMISIISFFLIGYSNMRKLNMLGEPLYPVDFYQVMHMETLLKIAGVHSLFIISSCIAALFFIFTRIVKKLPKINLNWAFRGVIIIICSAIIYSYGNYENSFLNKYVEKSGVSVVLWSQPDNYISNGFVFGLLSNLQTDIMEKPEDYTKENVLKIAQKYKAAADDINRERSSSISIPSKPNIIFVMDESFWDPTRLNYLNFSEDPMKNIRSLMSQYSSGLLLSPCFGGGTANVEFEALTGLSMYNNIQGSIPYQQSLDTKSQFPSIVSTLEEQNYDTVAIHPYNKVFYKRDKVYTSLGFNSFISEKDIKYKEILNKDAFISDQSVVNEITDVLKEKDKPVFIHAVTMQNHMPYFEGKNGENSISISTNVNLEENSIKELESYSEGIKKTDAAIKNLVDQISKINEPTMLVFWGDHLPVLNNDIYEQLKNTNSQNFENERVLSETPLLIYSNFNLKKDELKTVSPAFLGVSIFDMMGSKLSPYYAMLETIKTNIPGLKDNVLIDSKGNLKNELSESEKNMLNEYKLIQYDLLMGKQYSLPVLFNSN